MREEVLEEGERKKWIMRVYWWWKDERRNIKSRRRIRLSEKIDKDWIRGVRVGKSEKNWYGKFNGLMRGEE